MLSITKEIWRRSLKAMGKIRPIERLNITFTSSNKQSVQSGAPINPTRVARGEGRGGGAGGRGPLDASPI